MQAGQLRHRITIQNCVEEPDGLGGTVETWHDVATVWATKAHKSSREFFAAQKIKAEVTDLFIIRFRQGVEPEMRVVWKGQTYDIIGADDPDGRRIELHLLCKAVE